MKRLLIIALFTLVSSTVMAYDFMAYTFDANGAVNGMLYYNIIDGGCQVTSEFDSYPYNDNYYDPVDIIIPSTVWYEGTSYSVISIGDHAFDRGSCINSITIPNSVTSIGESAFCECYDLTSITIPNSVTSIGERAFYYCYSLTSITIPSSVTSIGVKAFYECRGLTSITIPNSVTSIGEGAFSGCSGLTSITIPNSVTSIEGKTFAGCSSLTSITIPNSVTSIGEWAFSGCSGLTSITIPSSVTSIGVKAFYECRGLTKTNYTGSISQWCNIDFSITPADGGPVNSNYSSNPIVYSHNLFINNIEVIDLVIPDDVTMIKDLAFVCCTRLSSLTIGSSVTSIGVGAFFICTGLTEITSLNTVPPILYMYIDWNPFYGISLYYIPKNIPCGTLAAYQSAWGGINYSEDCGAIEEISEAPLIYQLDGGIIVEGGEGNIITLYDMNGRMLATKRDDYTQLRFDVPASGAYLIKIGNYPARKVVVIK